MEKEYIFLKEIVRNTLELTIFQKDKLNELSIKDFPFSESRKLISSLSRINLELFNILHDLEHQILNIENSTLDLSTLQDDVYLYSSLVWNLNSLVHLIEQSSREYISQSTVLLVSYLARKYASSSSFLLTPLSEHNFAYRNLRQELREILRDSIHDDEILKELPKDLSLLSFPQIHRDNIIANILLAHEIGHFIVNIEEITEKILPLVKINNKKLSSYIQQKSTEPITLGDKQTKLSDFVKGEEILARVTEKLTMSIKNWIIELLSDMIGFRLSGPVFVFAMADEFLSWMPYESFSETHPPFSYRIQLILNEIRKQNFLDTLDNDNKIKIDKLVSQLSKYVDISKSTLDPFGEIVLDSVKTVEINIIEHSITVTTNECYQPDIFGKEVGILIKKLSELTPPCEIDKGIPANIISILNAGMIYKMTWKDNDRYATMSREDIEDTERTINTLVLRSIEMSVIANQITSKLKRI